MISDCVQYICPHIWRHFSALISSADLFICFVFSVLHDTCRSNYSSYFMNIDSFLSCFSMQILCVFFTVITGFLSHMSLNVLHVRGLWYKLQCLAFFSSGSDEESSWAGSGERAEKVSRFACKDAQQCWPWITAEAAQVSTILACSTMYTSQNVVFVCLF